MFEDETYVIKNYKLGPWNSWFAWRPVRMNKKWVWMKKIYRRTCTYIGTSNILIWYEYGNIFDVLKHDLDNLK